MNARRQRTGFTLIEILIVISIIALVMAVAMPNAMRMYSSSAQAQATNLVSAQIGAARGIAIRDRQYTAVHFQRHFEKDEYWLAIVQLTPDGVFDLLTPTEAKPLPGSLAAGGVSRTMTGDDYSRVENVDDITTFTVVFDPSGKLVSDVRGGPIQFDPDGVLFRDEEGQVWDVPLDAAGVRAMCLFDVGIAGAMSGSDLQQWLDQNARFLVVNPYTSGLIRTRRE